MRRVANENVPGPISASGAAVEPYPTIPIPIRFTVGLRRRVPPRVRFTVERLGGIDVPVNNAALTTRAYLEQYPVGAPPDWSL